MKINIFCSFELSDRIRELSFEDVSAYFSTLYEDDIQPTTAPTYIPTPISTSTAPAPILNYVAPLPSIASFVSTPPPSITPAIPHTANHLPSLDSLINTPQPSTTPAIQHTATAATPEPVADPLPSLDSLITYTPPSTQLFACTLCTISPNSKKKIRNHVRQVHMHPHQFDFFCTFCKFATDSQSEFFSHGKFVSHHKKGAWGAMVLPAHVGRGLSVGGATMHMKCVSGARPSSGRVITSHRFNPY